MKKNFIELFEYNDWANSNLIDTLMKLETPPPKTIQLINHIIAAQDIWYERITGNNDNTIELWEENSLQECYVLSRQSTHNWVKFVNRSTEKYLRQDLIYVNSDDEEKSVAVSGIINHVLTHSHYHRGQINVLLSNNGITPPKLDLINFLNG